MDKIFTKIERFAHTENYIFRWMTDSAASSGCCRLYARSNKDKELECMITLTNFFMVSMVEKIDNDGYNLIVIYFGRKDFNRIRKVIKNNLK